MQAWRRRTIRAVVDRSTKLIARGGGTPGRVDRRGKRRFAYEVKHQAEGYYVVIEATAEPAAMAGSTGCSISQRRGDPSQDHQAA